MHGVLRCCLVINNSFSTHITTWNLGLSAFAPSFFIPMPVYLRYYRQEKQLLHRTYFHLVVEESKFVFEAKIIQRLKLLVLSTLQWKMNPVTPLSFVDHIVRRFGFKTDLHLEFLWRCIHNC
ncbi:hypothetical protein ACSBR1_008812 [Camellia fascicularis]